MTDLEGLIAWLKTTPIEYKCEKFKDRAEVICYCVSFDEIHALGDIWFDLNGNFQKSEGEN